MCAHASAIPQNPQVEGLMGLLQKREFVGLQLTGCDLSKATLPKSDGTVLLADPEPGLKLTNVVLGRGTQNYTCADSTENSTPVAQGAQAILYDVSCIAANHPSLLHELPDVLVQLQSSVEYYMATIFQRLSKEKVIVGHHLFVPDFSTAVFDFRITPDVKRYFSGRKDASVSATAYASKGPPGEEFGAVDWLRLKAGDNSVDLKLAYRVHTAGGKPPGNCKGRNKNFGINYAAEYWFYN
ncbi:hypothetical protein L873DRAFT_1804538 [Choiromyces venosus 120613-1]|uniref:Uncharacterized protein n=1 Tax=Choiromyces venosus 120613-1 TaxID=1336337 RepID=A0A3N4JR39_9PEZI|nr:hypothetical protein L873DRAFT_1804538 [Choiromyces venosus 120613-1]